MSLGRGEEAPHPSASAITSAIRSAVLLLQDLSEPLDTVVAEHTAIVVSALDASVGLIDLGQAASLLDIQDTLTRAALHCDQTSTTLHHTASAIGCLLLRREVVAQDERITAHIEQRAQELADVRFAATDPTLN